MIANLSPEQINIIKEKQAESKITEAPRKWVYNDMDQAVLVETEEDYDAIKSVYSLDKPGCDNRDIKVVKLGQAKRDISKAKRDIEKEASKKKAPAKKKDDKKED